MAQQVLSSLQNHINCEKVKLSSLEQKKLPSAIEFHSKSRELCLASDHALATMANPGPTIIDLLRQSTYLKSCFTQEQASLESEITNVKHNLQLKEHQLRHLQNRI